MPRGFLRSRELGNIYTRVQNPTWDALETRIAALEGGAAALAVASGQTASAYAVLNVAQAGATTLSRPPTSMAAPGPCSPRR